MRGIYNEITTKNEVTYMKKLLCLCLAVILVLRHDVQAVVSIDGVDRHACSAVAEAGVDVAPSDV